MNMPTRLAGNLREYGRERQGISIPPKHRTKQPYRRNLIRNLDLRSQPRSQHPGSQALFQTKLLPRLHCTLALEMATASSGAQKLMTKSVVRINYWSTARNTE
jgi:hypothetical protein